MKKKKTVSAVVVTRNRQEELTECLDSLAKSSHQFLEMVVVDNASERPVATWLPQWFPKVQLVTSQKNLGGAEGRNLGLKHTRGDFILFMDDDAAADKKLVAELLKVIDQNAKVGIVQPKIYDYWERNKIQGVGHDVNLKTGRVTGIGVDEEDQGQYDQPREVPMVGCCWLVRRKVFDQIGTYDGTFFIPYEDSDFCLRATRAGFKIFYVPKAKVWHRGLKSTFVHPWIQALGITIPERSYRLGRNKIIFMRKHARQKDLLIFLGLFLPFYSLVHSLVILVCRRVDILRDYWRGIFSGLFLKLDDGKTRSKN